MELHLLSSPGEQDIRYVIEACRPYLAKKSEPTVAFLPQATLNVSQWMDYTVRAFDGLAKVELIDTEKMNFEEMQSIIRRSQVVYVSGGNTFLLNHRLHISGLLPYLAKKIKAGLPLVGFSAGAVLCGPNILTANDLNAVETSYFKSLGVTSYNIFPHYPQDENSRAEKDGWLSDYHVFQDNPVLLLEDGAYIKIKNDDVRLVQGEAWILEKGNEKRKLEIGKIK
jgi:dipeptidase E